MNKLQSSLFESIKWSTPNVPQQTIAICKRQQFKYCLLPIMTNIDVEDDLSYEQKKII
jgi:glycosyltransferase A (GT-A) superfamily protein (DUF2064 family)